MKTWAIFRFHFTYQLRRRSTWISFALLVLIAFLFVRGNFLADALYADFYVNSPFVIATVTVFCSLFWFLLAAATGGELAARDVETGMHTLTYTAPVSRAEYLGGRFLAAFLLNALILLSGTAGVLLAVHTPEVDPVAVGPFRPAAYLGAYGYLALPNAFVGTAIHFSFAVWGRRSIASYAGSVLVFFVAYGGLIFLGFFIGQRDLAMLLDLFGHVYVTSGLITGWTEIEKSTRLIALEGPLLRSRLAWLGIALGMLALTHRRFRFAHHVPGTWWTRSARGRGAPVPPHAPREPAAPASVLPAAGRRFGYGTAVRQTLAIAGTSFGVLTRRWGGLLLLVAMAALAVRLIPEHMHSMGTPLLPRTAYVLSFLTAPLTSVTTPWVVIPLLIVLWSGELVWRDRDAGIAEITDAAPVPEWAALLGRFIALGMMITVWMLILVVAGVLIQLRLGHLQFEIELYLGVLLGLQLSEYLLFAVLALAVQGVVGHRYLGHLAVLTTYAFLLFASRLGVGHHLLVYGSAPRWTYSDMRGFGATLTPWRWFMAYWAAWALLLAVLATLFWFRGLEGGLRTRLRLARRRLTRPVLAVGIAAAAIVLAAGGIIFYNTNVLHEYLTDFDLAERSAEYERRYGRYGGAPQPRLRAARLNVGIHPRRRTAEIRGEYRLVNDTGSPIDTVHVSTAPGVRTTEIAFDRSASSVLVDERHGHRIHVLNTPLQPGDSLGLRFAMTIRQRGFSNGGVALSVAENATFFRNSSFPAIGYRPERELMRPGERRVHGLPARPLFPRLEEAEAGEATGGVGAMIGTGRVAFEAVVSTDEDQIAVAPGALLRTWTSGRRRFFHYASDAPIGPEWSFFSARYAVREVRWSVSGQPGQDVVIQVYHHPKHAGNVERMIRSVRASLDSYSREFGPYPFGYVKLVQNPGSGIGAHAAAALIDYTEGFTLFDPESDPRGLDLPFAVIAHEMAHQWWGAQLPYAAVEGAPLLIESTAWYAAMAVVEETYGREHLRRLLRFFRQPHPIPPVRQSVPLLRAMDPYAAYRKGPFALHALGEYVGRERVNLALRRLLDAHRADAAVPATSSDLYRQLQAVTPDSLQYLLHDLFAANTIWDLRTESATAEQTGSDVWRVTLRVNARKSTVDPAGMETEIPMHDWIQIGVFAPTGPGEDFGDELYLAYHRVRSGEQTIEVDVRARPAHAGIDPFHLLIDHERFDNVERVENLALNRSTR